MEMRILLRECRGYSDGERKIFMAKFREIKDALDRDMQLMNSPPTEDLEVRVRWEPPMRGWKVLNTDGAVRGNPGSTGAGGVIRGEVGEWVLGFSENVGHCSVTKAEVKAILRGLNLAKEIPTQKIWIQTYSRVSLWICSIIHQAGTPNTVLSYNNVDD